MNRGRLLLPAFSLVALLFGWKTYEAWTVPPVPPPPAAVSAPAPPAAAPADNTAQGPDLQRVVAGILARPLFRPDRQPFRESSPGASQRNYAAELGRFHVVGVLVLDGAPRAILNGTASRHAERYEVGPGDSLPGFTVKEVRQEGVVVVADGREFTIPMYAGGPRGTAEALRTEVPQRASPAHSPPAGGLPAATAARPAAAPPPSPAPESVQDAPHPNIQTPPTQEQIADFWNRRRPTRLPRGTIVPVR